MSHSTSGSFRPVGTPKPVKDVPEKCLTVANHVLPVANHVLPVANQWLPFIPSSYDVNHSSQFYIDIATWFLQIIQSIYNDFEHDCNIFANYNSNKKLLV